MNPFNAYYKDGNFVYEEVEAPYNSLDENEIDDWWDWVLETDYIPVDESKLPDLLCVTYNGQILPHVQSWKDVEFEFEDPVVEGLKKDGIFRETEYAEDPEDDDQIYEWQVFHPQVIRLPDKA